MCILCQKGNQSKYFHPKSWKDPSKLQHLQELEPSFNVQPDSCICRQCIHDAGRLYEGQNITPRWRKATAVRKKHCFVSGCTHSNIKVADITERESILEYFKHDENTQVLTQSESGTMSLCSIHYGEWYGCTHPETRLSCKTCGKRLEHTSKSRSIPEPQTLQTFLCESTKFEGTLHTDDRVCLTCYQSHLVMLKHIKKSVQSTDSDLERLIDSLENSIPNLPNIDTYDYAVEYATKSVAITLGKALLKQTAMLLPQVYTMFVERLTTVIENNGISTTKQDHPSQSWLRSQLSSLLEHHMTYRCSVRKYGTLLYRYGGDLVHALTVSLATSTGSDNTEDEGHRERLTQVCRSLNNKCHAQINKMIQEDSNSPHRIEQFEIDKFIDTLDPDIWEAICFLTQPASKKDLTTHVRKVRRVFVTCILFFYNKSTMFIPFTHSHCRCC